VPSDKSYGNEAENLWEKGEFEKAEKLMRKAIEINPNSSLWHQNLGFILEAQGKEKEAFDAFMNAIRIDSEWGNAYKTGSLMMVAQYFYNERAYADSISFLEKAINEAEKEDVDNKNLSRLYLYLSFNYEETETENSFYDLAKAERLKKKAYALNPDDLYTKASIAKLLIDQGKLDEARESISEIEIAVENAENPEKGGVYAYLAYIYSILKNPVQSSLNMSKAIEADPRYSKYLIAELDGDFRNVAESGEMKPVIEKAKAIVLE